MAFDWTTVDVDSMARRTISLEEGRSGGPWRQGAGTGTDRCGLESWLREQAAWDFDSLMLETDAEHWIAQMENAHLVLLRHDVFERARCELTDEPGHRHVRYCAGPSAAARQVQRRLTAMVARRSR